MKRRLGANEIAMLRTVSKGGQPKDGVATRAQIRAAGSALRSLLADGMLHVRPDSCPFVYALTDDGKTALEHLDQRLSGGGK